jgi:hypothetical protein
MTTDLLRPKLASVFSARSIATISNVSEVLAQDTRSPAWARREAETGLKGRLTVKVWRWRKS